MVTINLTGFDSSFPSQLKVAATTYEEAIEMLKLHEKFNPLKQIKRFVCKVIECADIAALKSRIVGDEINLVCESEVKAGFTGSGEQKMQVIIGVVLIVVGVVVTMAGFPTVGPALVAAGVATLIGAIVQYLLMPDEEEADDRQSRIAQRYPNTVASGTPKALILGKFRFGGHLISVNVESRDGVDLDFEEFVYNLWDSTLYSGRDTWETLYQNTETGTTGRLGAWGGGGGTVGGPRDEDWLHP